MTSREYVKWGKVADGLKDAARDMRSVPVLEEFDQGTDDHDVQQAVEAQQEAAACEEF